jgi:hypothetical protein
MMHRTSARRRSTSTPPPLLSASKLITTTDNSCNWQVPFLKGFFPNKEILSFDLKNKVLPESGSLLNL